MRVNMGCRCSNISRIGIVTGVKVASWWTGYRTSTDGLGLLGAGLDLERANFWAAFASSKLHA
jgi:hypothetical protein